MGIKDAVLDDKAILDIVIDAPLLENYLPSTIRTISESYRAAHQTVMKNRMTNYWASVRSMF